MALAFSPSGDLLAISGIADTVVVYGTQTWQNIAVLPVSGTLTSSLVFSGDGKTLLTASPCVRLSSGEWVHGKMSERYD